VTPQLRSCDGAAFPAASEETESMYRRQTVAPRRPERVEPVEPGQTAAWCAWPTLLLFHLAAAALVFLPSCMRILSRRLRDAAVETHVEALCVQLYATGVIISFIALGCAAIVKTLPASPRWRRPRRRASAPAIPAAAVDAYFSLTEPGPPCFAGG